MPTPTLFSDHPAKNNVGVLLASMTYASWAGDIGAKYGLLFGLYLLIGGLYTLNKEYR